jgi:hypothetical protein
VKAEKSHRDEKKAKGHKVGDVRNSGIVPISPRIRAKEFDTVHHTEAEADAALLEKEKEGEDDRAAFDGMWKKIYFLLDEWENPSLLYDSWNM